MTKAELAEAVTASGNLTRKEAADLVDALFGVIKEILERGEEVKISGFGKWNVTSKDARRGRNPQTGEEIVITGRSVVSFKASSVLKAGMNVG